MENTFTFKLTSEEADLIVKALGELQYKTSTRLIANLQMQYGQQQKSSENVENNSVETEKVS